MTSASVAWSEIVVRLADERTYWLSTVGPHGSPHVCPVWGVIVEDAWYFYSERRTVKARNLAANPRVALNLGSGEDVLIVHGLVYDNGHPADHPDVVAAFSAKYTRPHDLEFLPLADPAFDVMYVLAPSHALMWKLADYVGSQRRWRPESAPAAATPDERSGARDSATDAAGQPVRTAES